MYVWSEEEGSLGGDLGAVAQVAVFWGNLSKITQVGLEGKTMNLS